MMLQIIKSMGICGTNSKMFLAITMYLFLACSPKLTKNITKSPMKKNNYSVFMTDGVTLNVDFHGMGSNSVIFFDKTCVIIGVNNAMTMLVAQVGFDPINLPDSLYEDIFNLPNINFSPGDPFENLKYDIPKWLMKMSKMVYLRLEDAKLNDLTFLRDLNLKQLVLIKSEFENRDSVLKDISEILKLQYLVTDNLLTQGEISYLKEKRPDLVILSEIDYNKKIEAGEIDVHY